MKQQTFVPVRLAAALVVALAVAGCATVADAPRQAAAGVSAVTQPQVLREATARGLYELAYSPRQGVVFVASSGGFGQQAAPSRVLALDPATLAVVREIPLERKAFGVVLDDAADRLYVGNTVDTSVTVVDTQRNAVVGTVQLMEKVKGKDGKARYSHDLRELVVDGANDRLYVTGHSGEGSVLFVVNTRTLQVEKTIEGLGKAKAPGLVFDAAGSRVFTSNLLGEVVVVDTKALAVSQRFQTSAEQPMNLAFDAATQRLFITDQGLEAIRKYQTSSIPGFQSRHPGNRLLVLDAASGRELHSAALPEGPLAVRFDAPRARLYVTNRTAGKLSVLDSNSYKTLHTLDLPDLPNSLAFDDARNVLYVTIKNGSEQPKDANESVARIALP